MNLDKNDCNLIEKDLKSKSISFGEKRCKIDLSAILKAPKITPLIPVVMPTPISLGFSNEPKMKMAKLSLNKELNISHDETESQTNEYECESDSEDDDFEFADEIKIENNLPPLENITILSILEGSK